MTERSRAYRAARVSGDAESSVTASVLPHFADAIDRARDSGGRLDASAIAELARTVRLPIAAVRGAVTTYDDARGDPGAVRVCAGLSCALAGGGDLARRLGKELPCRAVHCLGYCDRSPAALTADGDIVPEMDSDDLAALVATLRGGHAPAHPAPPAIRCVARHSPVTGRLMANAAGDDPYEGLRAALARTSEEVVESIVASGLRGRGGAAYPTGNKWRLAAAADGRTGRDGPDDDRIIVANGDEGDPGSFIDRELMERDPHGILAGMAIAAHAVGARRGIVFIRSEYPVAARVMDAAIAEARQRGVLGAEALGVGRPFEVEVVRGLGSYVCGEETALLAAIEGRRGEVTPRPPYPVESGLFGRPTVVDNVETLVNVVWIARHGAEAFAAMGTADSRGTKALCFNHGFARPGIVEIEFGVTLREAIETLGGGGVRTQALEAVLLGGPMGSVVTPDAWDLPICFAAMSKAGINLGHGGMLAIPEGADWFAILRHLLGFMRHESCGKCVPCALGSRRAHELATTGDGGGLDPDRVPELDRILSLMRDASLCAFGRETPGPIRTILERFGERVLNGGRP